MAVVTILVASACTIQPAATPGLTGPSEFALSMALSATPDIVNQDGSSQSVIAVVARDAAASPIASLPVHLEMLVGGVVQDFGTLSARNLVTGADGRASAVFTAPPAPPPASGGTGTVMTIRATPSGSNFQTAIPQTAEIRLVPQGLILAPGPAPKFSFSPIAPSTGSPVTFDATASCGSPLDSGGACPASSDPISSFSWNFADGSSAAGKVVGHAFAGPGNFGVTLTVTSSRGVAASTTVLVPVSPPAGPKADFVSSPVAPAVDQSVVFDASLSSSASGHRIVSYNWNFGDLTSKSGGVVQHDFNPAGTYNVTLTIVDDVGQSATVSKPVTVH